MNLVYFAHSYRSEDAGIVDFFAELLRSESLIPALDPPSDEVNSARLERHLSESDGMVAILTRRGDSVSPHIRYEIALAIRARKPLLIHVEDALKHAVPARILQRRFSRSSFFRQAREQRHAVRILQSYVGETPPPRYQPLMTRRSCLVAGAEALGEAACDALLEFLDGSGYEPRDLRQIDETDLFEAVAAADVCVSLVDDLSPRAQFAMGALGTAFVPGIRLTTEGRDSMEPWVPDEYRPRAIPAPDDADGLIACVARELNLFEKDALSLDDADAAARYAEFLAALGGPGAYAAQTREAAVEVVMGDKYDVRGQAGAVGRGAHAHDITFEQTWARIENQVPLDRLEEELELLRAELRARAERPDQVIDAARVAEAEIAAREKDGPRALSRLKDAGRWALDVAQEIGASVAVAALKAALGLP